MFLYRYIYILLIPLFCMERETISLKINSQLWKDAKKNCIDKGVRYSDYVECLIKKDLGVK